MFSNARNDLFVVQFPKNFFEPTILRNYQYYKDRLTAIHIDFQSFINSTIKSIQLPALSYEKTEQMRPGFEERKRGQHRLYRPADEKSELFEKMFTITFEAVDGYLNYWIMFSLFLHFYDFATKPHYKWGDITLGILDNEGNMIFRVLYTDVLFVGLSEIEISYTNNTGESKTFECSFEFNDFKFEFLRS